MKPNRVIFRGFVHRFRTIDRFKGTRSSGSSLCDRLTHSHVYAHQDDVPLVVLRRRGYVLIQIPTPIIIKYISLFPHQPSVQYEAKWEVRIHDQDPILLRPMEISKSARDMYYNMGAITV